MHDDPLHKLAQHPRRFAVTCRHVALHEAVQLLDGLQVAFHGGGMEFDGADRTRVQGIELRLKLRLLGPGLLAGAIDADRVPYPLHEKVSHPVELHFNVQNFAFQARALIDRVRSKTPSLLLVGLQESLNVVRMLKLAPQHVQDGCLDRVEVVGPRIGACPALLVPGAANPVTARLVLASRGHSAAAAAALQEPCEQPLRLARE